jgi:outer membrane protein assembly factor BamB
VRWSRALGESYGIGSVSQGRYLQFDYADQQAQLLCLESTTGKLLWKFSYPSNYVDLYNYNSGPRTSPVIDDDRVYLYGVEGMLHCVNLADGSVVWKVDTQRQFGVVQNFFGVGSTPAISGDLLIVMVGGSPAEQQTLPPGQLDRVTGNGSAAVAFDKRTGQVRYQVSDELASYASVKLVERPDRSWCFLFARGGLLAFDPATGQQDFYFPWRATSLESVNASTPVVWDDYVFLSETYGPGAALLQFRTGGYQTIWTDAARRRDKAMQAHWNTPIYHEGYLYGCSGRHTQNAELRCIEALSGNVRWSQPGMSRMSLLYVDQHLIGLDEYGTLRVIQANPQRYELVREFQPTAAGTASSAADGAAPPLLKYPAWAAPIVAHGRMYVRGRDRVVCYELPKR